MMQNALKSSSRSQSWQVLCCESWQHIIASKYLSSEWTTVGQTYKTERKDKQDLHRPLQKVGLIEYDRVLKDIMDYGCSHADQAR